MGLLPFRAQGEPFGSNRPSTSQSETEVNNEGPIFNKFNYFRQTIGDTCNIGLAHELLQKNTLKYSFNVKLVDIALVSAYRKRHYFLKVRVSTGVLKEGNARGAIENFHKVIRHLYTG